MKRIANQCAVQTLLYTVRPYQRIRVIDRESMYDKTGKVVFDGLEKDTYGSDFGNRISYASIKEVKPNGDVLEIWIETKNEIY